ncbi:TPA: hypothetical protein PW462_002538, partial [Mannheimia haemolytica]|nr:hypothetical protein [Mannheimia haemolytica]
HYIIGYVGDNLERYQYNKSQLKSIVLMHEEIKNIVDKGILNKVKKPMWFIFFPTSILLFIVMVKFNSLLSGIMLFLTMLIAYCNTKYWYFRTIRMKLSHFMELMPAKEIINNSETKNILVIIEKCTFMNQKDEHIVDLDSIATGLNIIIRYNKFNHQFSAYKQ